MEPLVSLIPFALLSGVGAALMLLMAYWRNHLVYAYRVRRWQQTAGER